MSIREQLRTDLTSALKERDKITASTIRTALAAIENAAAVPVPAADSNDPMGTAGLSRDVERRALTATDVQDVLRREATERQHAISTYETSGQRAAADLVRAELQVLERYLS